MPEDAVDEHEKQIEFLMRKWKIPRREAQLLWEDQNYD